MKRHNLFAGKGSWRGYAGLLGVLWAVLLAATTQAATVSFGGFPNNSTHSSALVMAAIANVPTNAGVVYDPIGQTNNVQVFNFGTLVYTGPVNVGLTLQRIRLGYWMSTEKDDGGFFNFNSAGELPNIPRKGNNYYLEFVVWPFIDLTNATYNTGEEAYGVVAYPGPMRLLIGRGGEVWFTGDHYGKEGPQLNAENVNPPPPPGVFPGTNGMVRGTNTFLNWNTIGGQTNFVQASESSGPISNSFMTSRLSFWCNLILLARLESSGCPEFRICFSTAAYDANDFGLQIACDRFKLGSAAVRKWQASCSRLIPIMNAQPLTPEGERIAGDLARRYGFTIDAVTQMMHAVLHGNGYMAQFSHPEFGGSGQWMRGGMLMLGDMFNYGLKNRVDSLCNEISGILANQPGLLGSGSFQSQSQGGYASQTQATGAPQGQSSLFLPDPATNWWPKDLGAPNATGSQNSVRYAYFSGARRLAVQTGSDVWVYDTLDHQIGGFSQQQGSGGSILFTSQFGTVNLSTLPVVSRNGQPFQKLPAPFGGSDTPTGSGPSNDVLTMLERLGALKMQGVLTDAKFNAKKAELLSRL